MATEKRFARIRQVLESRQSDLTVLLEKVHKPHNFNAILRSCDAVGVAEAHAELLQGGACLRDLTSQGTAKWVRVHLHDSVADAAAHLKERGFQLVAANPQPGAVDYRDFDFTLPVAVVLGAELYGVSEESLSLVDHTVKIPMFGMGASLNVSVAAALILYEARRQREEAGLYDQPRLDPATHVRLLFEWAHPEVAEYCRKTGRRYPRLSPEGEIVEKIT